MVHLPSCCQCPRKGKGLSRNKRAWARTSFFFFLTIGQDPFLWILLQTLLYIRIAQGDSSGRGSLGGVVISAGGESRERIHHSSRPETCLGFEYTHWGLSEKRGEPWTDAMEGPCCQRSASDSTQDRLGQPDSHRSSTDGNTDMTSIISQLEHEDKCYHQISGFFIFPILWFPALARVMGVLRKRESHTRAPWEQNSEVPDWSSPKCGAHTSADSTNIS